MGRLCHSSSAIVSYDNLTFQAQTGLIANYVTVVQAQGEIGDLSEQDYQRIADALTRQISDNNLLVLGAFPDAPICRGWPAVTIDDVMEAVEAARRLLEK